MNRRSRKKKETGLFDGLQQRLSQINTNSIKAHWEELPQLHRRALLFLVPFVLILILLPVPKKAELDINSQITQTNPVRTEVTVNTNSLSEEGETKRTVTKTDEWEEYTVSAGDTLTKVFRANNLSMADLNALIAIEGLDKPLSKLQAGQIVRFKLAPEGHLDILQLEKSNTSVMFFRLSDGGYGRSK